MDTKKRINGVHLALYRALVDEAPLDGEAPLSLADVRKWQRYQVMKQMGWTIGEYQEAPAGLIEEIWLMMQTEQRAINDRMERANGA